MTDDQIAENILKEHDDWLNAGGSHASPDVKRHMLRTRIADHLQAAYGRGVREATIKIESRTARLAESPAEQKRYTGTGSSDLAKGTLIGMAISSGGTSAETIDPLVIPVEAAAPVPPRYRQPEPASPEPSGQTDSTSRGSTSSSE